MLNIVASFDAKWNAAQRIASEKAENNAPAPLITSALILCLRPLFFVILAVRALE